MTDSRSCSNRPLFFLGELFLNASFLQQLGTPRVHNECITSCGTMPAEHQRQNLMSRFVIVLGPLIDALNSLSAFKLEIDCLSKTSYVIL